MMFVNVCMCRNQRVEFDEEQEYILFYFLYVFRYIRRVWCPSLDRLYVRMYINKYIYTYYIYINIYHMYTYIKNS